MRVSQRVHLSGIDNQWDAQTEFGSEQELGDLLRELGDEDHERALGRPQDRAVQERILPHVRCLIKLAILNHPESYVSTFVLVPRHNSWSNLVMKAPSGRPRRA